MRPFYVSCVYVRNVNLTFGIFTEHHLHQIDRPTRETVIRRHFQIEQNVQMRIEEKEELFAAKNM